MGTIEFVIPVTGFLAGLEPRFQVMDAAGVFDSVEHGQKVFTTPRSARASPSGARRKVSSPCCWRSTAPDARLTQACAHGGGSQGAENPGSPARRRFTSSRFKKLGVAPLSMALGESCPRCKIAPSTG